MRFVSPSILVFALFLFLLPWVDLRCEAKPGFGSNFGAKEPGVRGSSAPAGGSLTVFYQSGLQSTWGEVSLSGYLEGRRFGGGGQAFGNGGQALEDQVSRTDPAPMMIGYGLCLLAGIVLGYAMRSSKRKGVLLGGICLTACGLLMVQTIVGFPFFKSFEGKHATILAAIGVDPSQVTLATGYTPFFYLAILTTVAAFLLAVIEPAVAPRKRRRPRYDDDDDEEDEAFADKFYAHLRRRR
jgi:hypothetical protein